MTRLIVFLVAALVLPSGCAQRESAMAEDGQQRLIGLRSDDLRLCAGVPDRTVPGATANAAADSASGCGASNSAPPPLRW